VCKSQNLQVIFLVFPIHNSSNNVPSSSSSDSSTASSHPNILETILESSRLISKRDRSAVCLSLFTGCSCLTALITATASSKTLSPLLLLPFGSAFDSCVERVTEMQKQGYFLMAYSGHAAVAPDGLHSNT
jgi:hypothetical protein